MSILHPLRRPLGRSRGLCYGVSLFDANRASLLGDNHQPGFCAIKGVDTRLKLGIALLILGLVMPAGTLFVTSTDWPDGVKGVVIAFLLLGFEIMMVPAVALMGKENFDRIVARAKRVLKSLKPSGDVSRGRYRLGLMLFVCPLLYAWVAAYVPALQPEDAGLRLWLNLGLDLTLVISLFVLGGDFWDKLRALFVHESRAVFPPSAPDTRACSSWPSLT